QDNAAGGPTASGSQTAEGTLLQGDGAAGGTQAGASSVTNTWTTASKQWAGIGINIRHARKDTTGAFVTGEYTSNTTTCADSCLLSDLSTANSIGLKGQLGFEPDYVFIKAETTQRAVVRTATMNGDSSKDLATNAATVANLIQDFEAPTA